MHICKYCISSPVVLDSQISSLDLLAIFLDYPMEKLDYLLTSFLVIAF